MFFVGNYDLSLDPKNRLSIPADFRAALNAGEDGTDFYIVPGREEKLDDGQGSPAVGTSESEPDRKPDGAPKSEPEVLRPLYLYPSKYFRRMVEEERRSQKSGRAREVFENVFFAYATPLEVDKQGRVVLPQWAIERGKLEKAVKMSGAYDRLVIWSPESFGKYVARNYSKQGDLRDEATDAKPAGAVAGS